ncbi:SDR family oxidoreductase [Flavivirga amylovorans]|uniref:SDR family oxidoreductase n=1 Tax=Flavivirga amylovorans TaxID=870486 RepID=A0ABT8X5J1_9FLAO|nr:SDR family oxidoreductase [Flavivirga amylovorans]MDO5989224.1 SDR family oxidoreductase [Flavivirga amylovorans]
MKHILIIGGTRGIGASIVSKLQEDHKLFIASRTNDSLSHPNVVHVPFDATKDDLNTSNLPESLNGFIYCPGSINLKPFKMMDLDTFESDMQVNFFSLVKVVKAIIPRMSDSSSMVFFSTIAVGTGMPFHTSVAAAKGAVEGFAKSMAAEYAPKIRINVIAPSLVNTPLAGRLLNNDKKKEAMGDRHPLKRVGEAHDIAHIATFLLSEQSSWITGQIIGVDGGLSTLNIN